MKGTHSALDASVQISAFGKHKMCAPISGSPEIDLFWAERPKTAPRPLRLLHYTEAHNRIPPCFRPY
jgi:hypothetical protein